MTSLLNIAGNVPTDAFAEGSSLRFEDGDSAYLSWTPASAGNRKTWTWSGWVKIGNGGAYRQLMRASATMMRFTNSDTLQFERSGGAVSTSALYRDPSAWYHVCFSVDTTQSTASDRVKLYVNGVLETLSGTFPVQNTDYDINNTTAHYIGQNGSGSEFYDGYLANVTFIDGTALTPTSFGEYEDTVWKPKSDTDIQSLTFGTNGFYLNFEDSSAIGDDTSGNANDWTANNLVATDVVPDSPVTNFATFNSLVNVTGGSFSEGNLKVTTGSSAYGPAISSFAVSSGKWYSEFLTTASSGDQRIGGVRVSTNLTTTYDLGNSGSFAYRQNDGQKKIDGTQSAYGATWAANDIIGMALNLDDDEVTFYKNGSSQGTFSITAGEYFLATSDGDSGAGMGAFVNFGQDSSFAGNETPQGNTDDNGQGDFYYAPPSGFLALCRNNLPAPSITAPDEYFNTVLYTGNSSTQSITGVNFQPSWLWIKNRSTSNSHALFDSVRGSGTNGLYGLQSNTTNAEIDGTNVASLDSDGFTLGSNGGTNGSGNALVAWNWLAGGTAVSNTDGSITSSVSANTDAGFSIVSYTGNATSGATVGHGLSQKPEILFFKNRDDGTRSWVVYSDITGTNGFLILNSTAAFADASSVVPSPTSSVFYLHTFDTNNGNGDNHICYSFHSVEGYSKIGSYTGNGSADGVYIHLGFRPAMIMLKASSRTGRWIVMDNKRDTDNVAYKVLAPNYNYAEDASTTYWLADFLSNGVKLRYGADTEFNQSGQTYIFYAVAEAPFKNANAR